MYKGSVALNLPYSICDTKYPNSRTGTELVNLWLYEKGSVPPAGQETLFPPSLLEGRWVAVDMFLNMEPARLLY